MTWRPSDTGLWIGIVAVGAIVLVLIALSPTDANTRPEVMEGEFEPEIHSGKPKPQSAVRVPVVVDKAPIPVADGSSARITSQGESDTDHPDEQRETYLASRSAELRKLALSKDPTALEAVLLDARDPDADMRQAALEVISLSGNRYFIPRLRELAAQMQDSAEKQAIVEAAEFLELPTLTELMRREREEAQPGAEKAKPN